MKTRVAGKDVELHFRPLSTKCFADCISHCHLHGLQKSTWWTVLDGETFQNFLPFTTTQNVVNALPVNGNFCFDLNFHSYCGYKELLHLATLCSQTNLFHAHTTNERPRWRKKSKRYKHWCHAWWFFTSCSDFVIDLVIFHCNLLIFCKVCVWRRSVVFFLIFQPLTRK